MCTENLDLAPLANHQLQALQDAERKINQQQPTTDDYEIYLLAFKREKRGS